MSESKVRRSRSATTKVTEAEYAQLESQADSAHVNLSEWIRSRLLTHNDNRTEVLLAEVLALRAVVFSLLFSLSQGERKTLQEMQSLIEQADAGKAAKAAARLLASSGNGGRR